MARKTVAELVASLAAKAGTRRATAGIHLRNDNYRYHEGIGMDFDPNTIKTIQETHTNVAWLISDAEKRDKRMDQVEGRVRRIENAFVPLVAVVGIGTHKVMVWLKL